ncbi:MAG: DUF6531 domain-containing protein [Anaerolineales bacterium]
MRYESSAPILTPTPTITPTPTPTPTQPPIIEHCGTIVSDETWIGGGIHLVTCDVSVSINVSLTIGPGAAVKFERATSLFVHGALRVEGDIGNPVNFTSYRDDSIGGDTNGDGASTGVRGDWNTILFADTSNDAISLIENAELRYGGDSNWQNLFGSITLNEASPTIRNTQITESQYCAITADLHSYPGLSGNTIENNDANGLCLYGGTLDIDATWDVTDTTYYLLNPITIAIDKTLGVDPGVIVKFAPNRSITVNGALRVLGTAADPVYFTSYRDDSIGGDTNGDGASTGVRGDWNTILFADTSNDAISLIENAELRYGGDSNWQNLFGSITLNEASPTIRNTQITESQYCAITADLHSYPGLSGNTIENNDANGLCLYGGTLDIDATWDVTDTAYYLSGSITVATGNSLTVNPGVVVKLQLGVNLIVDGALQVSGTSADPVYFTSFRDDVIGGDTNGDGSSSYPAARNWGRIQFSSGSDDANSSLDYLIVRYGGYNWYGTIRLQSSSIPINNSVIEYNYRGVEALAGSAPIIRGSSIHDNQAYGVYSDTPTVPVDARFNWWGHDSGPYHPTSNPGGLGDTVSDGVLFDPWTGKGYWVASRNGQAIPWNAYESDPVNTANGNYAYQRTDLSVPTRSLPLEFVRAYNSLNPKDSPLGFGWTHSYATTAVENSADDSVIIHYGDGRQARFTWDGAAYRPPAGTFSTLEKISIQFRLTLKNQSIYDFDPQGRLTSITDRNGNLTALNYTGDLLSSVVAPDGRSLTFNYGGSDRLIQLVDPIGRTVDFAYDASRNLVAVTDPSGAATSYSYDADHRLLSITDANGHTFVSNTYDSGGRVIEQRDALNNPTIFVYDLVNRTTDVTNPRGNTTRYEYDADLRLLRQTDALGKSDSYTYDTDNNRTSVTDRSGNITSFTYDDRGNVLNVIDPSGGITTMTYDAMNNLLSRTNALGRTTNHGYDVAGNLLSQTDPLGNITSYTYYSDANRGGLLGSQTDPLGHTISYDYNAQGDLAQLVDALGNATTFTNDLGGRKLSETDALARPTSYSYDTLNRILTVTDSLGAVTGYSYDAVGNRTSVTDANGYTTAFAYDAKDRLASVTDPLGSTTSYAYDAVDNQTAVTDPLGRTTNYAYDVLNRRTSVTDPLGNATTYTYDAVGNRASIIDANGNTTSYGYDARNQFVSVADAAGGTVTYAYDAVGNRTSMTDANGHTTAYSYDALNRLVSATDPLGNTVGYGYDAAGNRASKSKPDGVTVSYTYDALNLLVAASAPGLSISYAYNAVGNRTSMTDGTGTTSYAYDALDRLIQGTYPGGDTLGYSYDAVGNRTGLTYPGGQTASYAYDAADRMTSVTDWDANMVSYSYDVASQLADAAYPNGTSTAYSYDNAGRVTDIVHANAGGIFASYSYTYDPVGNRLSEVSVAGTTSYSYDTLHRLTGVTYPDGETVTYTYDPMGNRTLLSSDVSGDAAYTYDAGDRLLTAGSEIFTWDANGNMASRTQGTDTTTYTFDPLDRLTQVVSPTASVGFDYTGDGVRVGKTVDGVTMTYIQDLEASLPFVLVETAGGQDTLYLSGLDLLAQIQSNDSRHWYHIDALGSTRALSDEGGQLLVAYEYDAFGAVRSQSDSSTNRFLFTGEQLDLEISKVYLRARYYQPAIGRFISRDPIQGFVADPTSLSRYIYARSNPATITDPSGQFPAAVPLLAGLACSIVDIFLDVQQITGPEPISEEDVAIEIGSFIFDKAIETALEVPCVGLALELILEFTDPPEVYGTEIQFEDPVADSQVEIQVPPVSKSK